MQFLEKTDFIYDALPMNCLAPLVCLTLLTRNEKVAREQGRFPPSASIVPRFPSALPREVCKRDFIPWLFKADCHSGILLSLVVFRTCLCDEVQSSLASSLLYARDSGSAVAVSPPEDGLNLDFPSLAQQVLGCVCVDDNTDLLSYKGD